MPSTRSGGRRTQSLGSAQALLDALRGRGLKTGVVANSWPEPARLLRADAEALRARGAARRPGLVGGGRARASREPEIFLRALDRLGVDADDAMFVGDRLDTDIRGAGDVGLTTVQALWFAADEATGVEPDFMAFTPMDVLNIARRLGD